MDRRMAIGCRFLASLFSRGYHRHRREKRDSCWGFTRRSRSLTRPEHVVIVNSHRFRGNSAAINANCGSTNENALGESFSCGRTVLSRCWLREEVDTRRINALRKLCLDTSTSYMNKISATSRRHSAYLIMTNWYSVLFLHSIN